MGQKRRLATQTAASSPCTQLGQRRRPGNFAGPNTKCNTRRLLWIKAFDEAWSSNGFMTIAPPRGTCTQTCPCAFRTPVASAVVNRPNRCDPGTQARFPRQAPSWSPASDVSRRGSLSKQRHKRAVYCKYRIYFRQRSPALRSSLYGRKFDLSRRSAPSSPRARGARLQDVHSTSAQTAAGQMPSCGSADRLYPPRSRDSSLHKSLHKPNDARDNGCSDYQ